MENILDFARSERASVFSRATSGFTEMLESGATEPGVQGVQLHTHFLAPSFGEDHLFPSKFGRTLLVCTPTC